jgi:glycosyltransferase involved in cell wall biosynthesis
VTGAKLSVIIPCYNELNTIADLYSRVARSIDALDIVIVDDGSTDGTQELLQTEQFKGARVVVHPRNLGKGAALRTASQFVRGDVVIIQDADLEYDPKDFSRLIEPIAKGEVSVVFGSRFAARRSSGNSGYRLNRVFNFLLTALCNALSGTRLTDVAAGYKAFRRELFQALPFEENGFACDTEMAVALGCSGVPLHEVPISYAPRTYEQGKKIRARDGLHAVWTAFRVWASGRKIAPIALPARQATTVKPDFLQPAPTPELARSSG